MIDYMKLSMLAGLGSDLEYNLKIINAKIGELEDLGATVEIRARPPISSPISFYRRKNTTIEIDAFIDIMDKEPKAKQVNQFEQAMEVAPIEPSTVEPPVGEAGEVGEVRDDGSDTPF